MARETEGPMVHINREWTIYAMLLLQQEPDARKREERFEISLWVKWPAQTGEEKGQKWPRRGDAA